MRVDEMVVPLVHQTAVQSVDTRADSKAGRWAEPRVSSRADLSAALMAGTRVELSVALMAASTAGQRVGQWAAWKVV